MSRKPEIDSKGVPAVAVAVRFSSDVVEMVDLLSPNRSKFVREATWEKISKEMESNES